jgi:hypothetical protein
MQSTDGECTRVFITRSNYTTGMWCFDAVQSSPTLWTLPVTSLVLGATTNGDVPTLSNLVSNANYKGWFSSGGTSIAFAASQMATGSWFSDLYTSGDDLTLEFPFFTMPLVCTTQGHRGKRGNVYDMWTGSSSKWSGTTYPEDGSRQFAQFGYTIVPWNGTSPITA